MSVKAGYYVHIPKGAVHRLHNTSASEDLVFIETQLGDKVDEEDIIRYRDDYGRVLAD